MSAGRLRLGVGVGWNHVEYEALGAEWKTRGARQAEQIKVMRRLWTEDLVTFTGRFHDLQSVSLLPPPVQRPIPVWFGGSSDAVVKRAAMLGDGWMPMPNPRSLGARRRSAPLETLDELSAMLAYAKEHAVTVSGTVTEVNEELKNSPEKINTDAHSAWIIKVELSDPGELNSLLAAADYEKFIAEETGK